MTQDDKKRAAARAAFAAIRATAERNRTALHRSASIFVVA